QTFGILSPHSFPLTIHTIQCFMESGCLTTRTIIFHFQVHLTTSTVRMSLVRGEPYAMVTNPCAPPTSHRLGQRKFRMNAILRSSALPPMQYNSCPASHFGQGNLASSK